MNIIALLKNKKLLLGLVLILAAGFFLIRRSSGSNGTDKPKTIKVQRGSIVQTVSASGKIKTDEETSLKFQTIGQLSWVGVKKGDHVKKWQAVAGLDQNQLQKQLKQELIDFMAKRVSWDQYVADNKDKAYDAATAETVRRTGVTTRDSMDRSILDVEIADIAIKYSTLLSPIDGIVTKIDFPNPGVNILTTNEIIVSNPDKTFFSANVDEADIGKVTQGQSAKVALDAYSNETFDSKVEQVEFTPTLTSGGGTAYAIKFYLPLNPNEKFKIGMNGDAEITVNQKDGILTVPQSSVREESGMKYLWVKENGKAMKRKVETGLSNEESTEIITGLNEGEEVYTSGFKTLEQNGKRTS